MYSDLIEEIENFEDSGLPIIRPNTMNNYGVIIDEMGMKPFIDGLLKTYLYPFVVNCLYKDLFIAKPEQHQDQIYLDDHHSFIVKYRDAKQGDKKLDLHFDDSEVTFNVCLGKKSFTGSRLYFQGLQFDSTTHWEHFRYTHRVGRAVVHLGRHLHGADPISGGCDATRYNLIVWCRSKALRQPNAEDWPMSRMHALRNHNK
jgi:hypothetical protein